MPLPTTPPTLADIIQETVRPLVAATPAPRGLPYLGLDHPSGTSLATLDGFATRGIFRKYELVLDLGTPLGPVSRWLVSRLGGDAVAATPTRDDVVAATELTRRSAARARVQCLAGSPTQLPLPSARFTHVWLVENLTRFDLPAAVLAEAYRVARPGGWLGVQEIIPVVAAGPSPATALPGWVEGAGFIDLRVDDVTSLAIERNPQLIAARVGFERRLESLGGDHARQTEAARRTRSALESGAARVVQLIARRPG